MGRGRRTYRRLGLVADADDDEERVSDSDWRMWEDGGGKRARGVGQDKPTID
jgi:hypothetical protein